MERMLTKSFGANWPSIWLTRFSVFFILFYFILLYFTILFYFIYFTILSYFILFYFILFYFILFLEPHRRHMEIPRLGVKSELELPAYTTATAMWGRSHVCYHSSQQCQIPNPLSHARDQTCVLMDTSRVSYC